MSATEICNTLPKLIDKLTYEISENLSETETRERLNNEIQKNKLFGMIWDVEDVLNYILDIKKEKRGSTFRNERYIANVEKAKTKLNKIFAMIQDGTFFTSEDKYDLACMYIETLTDLKETSLDYEIWSINRNYVCRYGSGLVRNDEYSEAMRNQCSMDIFSAQKQDYITMLGKNKKLKILFSTAGSSISIVNDYKTHEMADSDNYPEIEAYAIYNEAIGQYPDFIRSNYKNVAVGYIDKIICTSAAFDIVDMVYYDDVDYVLVDEDGKKSTETGIKYLERNLRYVKDGGYVLITIPRSSISKKFLSTLANNGDIIMDYAIEEEDIQHVMIVFQKDSFASDMTGARYRSYRKLFHDDDHFKFMTEVKDIIIPEEDSIDKFQKEDTRKLIVFRGDKADTEMFLNVLRKSSVFIPKTEELAVKPTPLLPLTKGQVGQILVSGSLNGIIDEGNGYKHIIKGSVSSDTMNRPVEFTSMADIEEYAHTGYYKKKTVEYKSNGIHLTILTADGEVKYL